MGHHASDRKSRGEVSSRRLGTPAHGYLFLDTIAAIATPPGRGGVGIVRISGPKAAEIGQQLTPELSWPVTPRQALLTHFHDHQSQRIDHGLLLHFPAPHSFTGEHVVELQAHGGPIVLEWILQSALQAGARLARPGEFSEQAYLNDKVDLAQAEAIADLISASSEQAARSALMSLQGVFSQRINDLLESLITLRLHVEAAIDFPEEEIDFLADGLILQRLLQVQQSLNRVIAEAEQGVLQQEGMRVVIAGLPNAGKSSLLNALAGHEAAIVTDIAGTTRDVLREHIQIDGMPLHIIDTAGLRESPDIVEQEGIRRALVEVEKADQILFVWDCSNEENSPESQLQQFFDPIPQRLTLVANKCDKSAMEPGLSYRMLAERQVPCMVLSAREGLGLPELKEHLKALMGYEAEGTGQFSARRRHVDALKRSQQYLIQAETMLTANRAGELAAEDLRLAQQCLSEITGSFSSDDLLGRIFSSFCIGK